MNLNEYQDRAFSTSLPTTRNLTYMTLGLCNEAGEVAGKLKKNLRGDADLGVQALTEELGDVLWYLAGTATMLGVDLEEVAQANLNKLLRRVVNGTIQGDGDNR